MRNRERFEGRGRFMAGRENREVPTYWRGGRRHLSGYDANEEAHAMYDQGYTAYRDADMNDDERSWSNSSAGREGYGGNPREGRAGMVDADFERVRDEERLRARERGYGYAGRLGYGGQARGGETAMGRDSWRGEIGYGGQMRGDSHAGKGPRNYKRGDERIREDVCERLTESHDVDASDLDIEVKNGEVVLTGTVRERVQKHVAEQLADSVAGVVDVRNEIRVVRDAPPPEAAQPQPQPQPPAGNGSRQTSGQSNARRS